MVHSTEWTTGSRLFGAFDQVSALFPEASGPLDGVVHWLAAFKAFDPVSALFPGSQWSTLKSGPLAHGFSGLLARFLPFSEELVVHSFEWTTSSHLFLASNLVSALS